MRIKTLYEGTKEERTGEILTCTHGYLSVTWNEKSYMYMG